MNWASPYPAIEIHEETRKTTCVIGDLHLGIETSFLRSSPLFSSFLSEETIQTTINLTRDHEVQKLVVLGDVKHSIRGFTPLERKLTEDLFQRLLDAEVEVEIIRGNHDYGVKSVVDRFSNVRVTDEAYIRLQSEDGKSFMITHGHRRFEPEFLAKSDHLVVGHIHPCIRLTRDVREPTILRVHLEFTGYLEEFEQSMKVTVLPAFCSVGCYLFSPTEVKERLETVRALDFQSREILVFDLAHNFLGTLGDLKGIK